jgi:putative ABC transport system substrate-binding protein
LNRPGGNLTGFLGIEASIAGKWLTMLKAVAPVARVALIANPMNIFDYFVQAVQPVANSLGIELVPSAVTSVAEISRYRVVCEYAERGPDVSAGCDDQR